MAILGFFRWVLFAAYSAVFFTLPLSLLWNETGFVIGLALCGAFLYRLRAGATEKIAKRLRIQTLTRAESPLVHSLVDDYCRRLSLTPPRIAVIETPALNFALFGFSRAHATLVLTRGALESFKPSEISALLAHELTLLWHTDISGDSWLSQFLATLNWIVDSSKDPSAQSVYSFSFFVKQVILYPLGLFPILLLKTRKNMSKIDGRAAKLCGNAQSLAEALRLIDAMRERTPFSVPLSVRHLFLLPPPVSDPLVRILFDPTPLAQRIASLEASFSGTPA